MEYLKILLKNFIEPHYISKELYLIMFFYILFSFLILYLILFSLKRNKVNIEKKRKKDSILKNELNIKNKFFSELKRKYKISPIIINNINLSFESFFIFNILFFTIIFLIIFFMLEKSFIAAFVFGFFKGVFITIVLINMQYEKRKRDFEKSFPEIGITINQNIQNSIIKKELREILKKIVRMDIYPSNEEFEIIERDYENNNDIKRALTNITTRYPDSQYLPRLKDILHIYYETKEDISELINITVDQVRNYEEIKKKTEIEVSPYIRIIYSIWFIGYSFLILYLMTNKLTREFYKSKIGIVSLILLNFIMFIGIITIEYLKMEVSKDEFMERIE